MDKYTIYALGVKGAKDEVYPDKETAQKVLSKMIESYTKEGDMTEDDVKKDEAGKACEFIHEDAEWYQAALLQKVPKTMKDYLGFIADRLELAISEYEHNLETTGYLWDIAAELRDLSFAIENDSWDAIESLPDDIYFYQVEEDFYEGKKQKLVHVQGNIYCNENDDTDTDWRLAEWTHLYYPVDAVIKMITDDSFYDDLNDKVTYLDYMDKKDAHKNAIMYFNGKTYGEYLPLESITKDTPCGCYYSAPREVA